MICLMRTHHFVYYKSSRDDFETQTKFLTIQIVQAAAIASSHHINFAACENLC